MHPAAAQSLLAPRPSKVAPFFALSIAGHVGFIFVGLLPWIFFSSSLVAGASAISDRRDLLTKVRFPAQVLPATVVATNFCNYMLSLPLMLILGAFYGVLPTWHALLFVVVVFVQTLFTVALAYLLSALNVAFRDLQQIVTNLLMLAFFMTPVIWPIENLPVKYRDLALYGNPMAAIVTSYQAIFNLHQLPALQPLAEVALLSILLLWFSSQLFERRREEFAELI